MNRILLLIGFSLVLIGSCESPQYPQGEMLYRTYCENCHMEDGTGLRKLIPPLTGSDYFTGASTESLVCLILNGTGGGLLVNGTQFNEPMPGFSNLKPADISNIINFLRSNFDNAIPVAPPQEVNAAYEQCR